MAKKKKYTQKKKPVPPGKKPKLSPKMLRFIEEFPVDCDKTKAAIRAGYSPSTAAQKGVQLYKDPRIFKLIQKKIDERSERTGRTADEVLDAIALSAYSNLQDVFDDKGRLINLKDLPREVAANIASMEVVTKEISVKGKVVDVEYIHKIKLISQENSRRDLGKNLKLFTEKIEANLTGDVNVTIKDYRKAVKVNK